MTELSTPPDWATALLGEGTALVSVLAGGSSRETLLLEVPAGRGRVVARHDRGAGPLSGTPFTLAREAATFAAVAGAGLTAPALVRSEEHTSELQSLMRISYAVLCLTKKNNNTNTHT